MAASRHRFNVEGGDDDYAKFISGVRSDSFLIARNTTRLNPNRPVLHPQTETPTTYFDMDLQDNRATTVRLRFNRSNLYLIGYQTGNQWWEFGTQGTTTQQISSSSFLGFDGSYGSLEAASGVGLHNRDQVPLGFNPFLNAFYALSSSTDRAQRAHALLVVIMMICESIRLISISTYLTDNYWQNSTLPAEMYEQQNGWGIISASLLRVDAGNAFQIESNKMGITTLAQAVAACGMILQTSTVTTVDRVLSLIGHPLVEFFSVCVNDASKVQGTITVTDGLGTQYLYKRTSKDEESIHPADSLLLTGLNRSIYAYDSFTIYFNLKDKHSLSPDSDKFICWNVHDIVSQYDKLLSSTISGNFGTITVNYVVISNAVQATIELTLTSDDGEKRANIYGQVVARNTNFENESVLFVRESDQHVNVHPQKSISLSRSIVAVPLNSRLIVQAKLHGHGRSSSADDVIANGVASFNPQLSGISEGIISDNVKVKVTWGL